MHSIYSVCIYAANFFLLQIFQFHKGVGYIVALLFWLASIGSLIGISVRDYPGILIFDGKEHKHDFERIYITPWCRIGPYIIGLVAGYVLYDFKKNDKRMHWVHAVLWWLISSFMAVAVLYGLRHYYIEGQELLPKVPTKAASVIYVAFSR